MEREVDDPVFGGVGAVQPRVIRYRRHGVQYVRPEGELRNTEPVGPAVFYVDGIIAEIDKGTLETICLKAILFSTIPNEFYDEFCDAQGYYDEARDFIRDLVWSRYIELRGSKS